MEDRHNKIELFVNNFLKTLQSEAEGAGKVDVGRRRRFLHEEGGGPVLVGRNRRAGGIQRGISTFDEPGRNGRQNEELFQESQFLLVMIKLVKLQGNLVKILV